MARASGAAVHAAGEHGHLDRAFDEIEALFGRVEPAAARDRPAIGRALYRRRALFVAADIEHVHGEATEMLQAMHDNISDAELRATEHRIVAA